jgi:hypothetical protein
MSGLSARLKRFEAEFFGKASPDQYHSWDYVLEEREWRTDSDAGGRCGLESGWGAMASLRREAVKRDDLDQKGTPVDAFRYFVDMGFYPPPEIMESIASAFGSYMSGKGKYELEDVFFGKRKRGVGNFASRRSSVSDYVSLNGRVHAELRRSERENRPKRSIEKIAEEMFMDDPFAGSSVGKGGDVDIGSFLRGYRRWKQKNGK